MSDPERELTCSWSPYIKLYGRLKGGRIHSVCNMQVTQPTQTSVNVAVTVHLYGTPFSHLFTELKISPIEVHISAIQLEISPIELKISPIQLKISPNQLEISTIKPI